jgi:hypothetical protein
MVSRRGGRPPIDPAGDSARKVSGVWLAPHDQARLDHVIARVRAYRGGTPASARRAVLLAGIDATAASLDAVEALARKD